MLILVTGRNNSGKSVFAEALGVRLRKKRYYIATMLPHGEEGAARVRKHVAQRIGLDFLTLECPYAVRGADVPWDAVALVEDISNLLSNAMFDKGASEVEVLWDMMLLCRRIGCVIAVTISEFDGGDYNEETLRYIRALQSLNQQLGALADVVIEMQEGIPIARKGTLHGLV